MTDIKWDEFFEDTNFRLIFNKLRQPSTDIKWSITFRDYLVEYERRAHALPKMKIENDQIDMKTQKLAEDVSFRKKDYEDLTL